jgi:hypothetical protein
VVGVHVGRRLLFPDHQVITLFTSLIMTATRGVAFHASILCRVTAGFYLHLCYRAAVYICEALIGMSIIQWSW